MDWLKNLFKSNTHKRNYAFSDMYQARTGQPVYTNFTIEKAVKEGLRINVWVYRCIQLICQAASSVTWHIEKDGEKVEGHAFNVLLDNPNPFISRQQFFELIISWMQLAGNAYIKRVQSGKRTVELWPISPDRLHPMPSTDIMQYLAGYALDNGTRVEFLPEEILHLMTIQDPSNPLLGLSPLQAAGRVVDSDNAQQAFNTAAMQNQGTTSGVWTFERAFSSQDEADALSLKLNERYAGVDNAKRMIVLGSNAKFQSTQMTPTEMDFLESRKTNRNEIFLAFGIPPAYGGSEEASTYNNFQSSELIFWNQTILPLLYDIRSSFNSFFMNELGQNEKIAFDVSNVTALRNAQLEKVKTAEILAKIGVPFEQMNKKFEFGFSEYDGWDKSNVSLQQDLITGKQAINSDVNIEKEQTTKDKTQDVSETGTKDKKKKRAFTLDVRAQDADKTADELEEIATGELFNRFNAFFIEQKKRIFDDLEQHKGSNIRTILDNDVPVFQELMFTAYKDIAGQFALKMVIEKRDAAELMVTQILGDLLKIVGVETGLITQTTIDTLFEQITEGLALGWGMQEFQQAIIDTGVFSPMRSLRIARTVATGAGNLGQITGARETGATHKQWKTAMFKVRDTHRYMEGKPAIPIDDLFSVGGYSAMYPGDNSLPAKERCNCRCSCYYTIE